MPVSEAQKRANQKWREANRERYNAICGKSNNKRYAENRESMAAASLWKYHVGQEFKRYLRILL